MYQPFLPQGMQHVDRDKLYSSLPIRVQYLQQFLDFGQDDLQALECGQELIRKAIPDIVDSVYKKLLQYDVTARVFSNHDSRRDDDPDVWAQDQSPAIQSRKIFLRWYLTKLNMDPQRLEYWEYLDKVGMMHVSLGRRNPLHVDYMFLGVCLGHIQDAFTTAILQDESVDLQRRIAIFKAIGKLIWIQNDLLARWHVNEGDIGSHPNPRPPTLPLSRKESASPLDNAGQKSLNSSRSSSTHDQREKTSIGRKKDSMDDSASRPGSPLHQCPFSGLMLDDQRAELRKSRPASRFSRFH